MRDRVAEALEGCPTKDISPLTRRLQDIVKDINEAEEQAKQERREIGVVETTNEWDPADEL